MTRVKTIRRWGLVVVAGLATVTSIACSGNDTNYPTQPPARNVKFVETTLVTAGFSFDDSAFLTVIFTDLSTGNVEKYVWDFGDGNKSTERNPVHAYRFAGTYAVGLTVSNSISSDSLTQFVDASEETEPTLSAGFSSTVSPDPTDLTVVFTDTSSGDVENYSWDFGDGGKSSARDPVYTYKAAGTYVVTLTVSNRSGSDSVSKFLTVPAEEQPPPGG